MNTSPPSPEQIAPQNYAKMAADMQQELIAAKYTIAALTAERDTERGKKERAQEQLRCSILDHERTGARADKAQAQCAELQGQVEMYVKIADFAIGQFEHIRSAYSTSEPMREAIGGAIAAINLAMSKVPAAARAHIDRGNERDAELDRIKAALCSGNLENWLWDNRYVFSGMGTPASRQRAAKAILALAFPGEATTDGP